MRHSAHPAQSGSTSCRQGDCGAHGHGPARKMSRAGRMPRWQKQFAHTVCLLTAASGLLFEYTHSNRVDYLGWGAHDWLVLHGVAAYGFAVLLGSVLPVHIRAAWHAKRNVGSGLIFLGVLLGLLFSGLGLYYGPEETHELIEGLHWWAGLGLVAVLPVHWVLGKRQTETRLRQAQAIPVSS